MVRPGPDPTPPNGPGPSEREAAILREILAVYRAGLDVFQPVPPPPEVRRFLQHATVGQLQGALIEVLAALHRIQDG
jgi:hypothetical protein